MADHRCCRGAYVAGLLLALLTACAPKAAPVMTGAPKHPDFVFPASPEGTAADQQARIDRGWQYLQLDDHRNAEREFGAALKQRPSFHPAETAMAYLAMARGNEKDAATRFDKALQVDATYVPALIGRGQAMLELNRVDDALASFEAALAKDPSLTDLRSRIDVLRFRATQDMLSRAKAAADARRWDEAAAIYRQAIAASPDSGFLYRDLATVEERAGQSANALEHYRKAIEIDAGDARSHAGVGAILESQGDVVGALAAFERARAIDAREVPDGVLDRLRSAAAFAKLPEEYRTIASRAIVTRADIAALIAVRLEDLIARAQQRQVIITDIRGHWGQEWINAVVRRGVMDTLANYEFQPSLTVRRGELANTVARLLSLVDATVPGNLRSPPPPQPPPPPPGTAGFISDVPPTHLSYPAVSTVVSRGLMPLSNGAFGLLTGVSGAEAIEIISKLQALARRR